MGFVKLDVYIVHDKCTLKIMHSVMHDQKAFSKHLNKTTVTLNPCLLHHSYSASLDIV